MSTSMLVTKNDRGKLRGWGDKGAKAYRRFKRVLEKLEPGELVEFSYWFPRHGKFHRLHFVMLGALFDSQEVFTNREAMRGWLEIGAGHAIFVKHGRKMVAIPDSISYRSLDDEKFREHHEKVKAFVRTLRARRYLWPHMTAAMSHEMAETILAEFERDLPEQPPQKGQIEHDTFEGEYERLE